MNSEVEDWVPDEIISGARASLSGVSITGVDFPYISELRDDDCWLKPVKGFLADFLLFYEMFGKTSEKGPLIDIKKKTKKIN